MTIKFVENEIFPLTIKVPHRGGVSADVADILQVLCQGEGTLMMEEDGYVDGWSVHVIPPEATEGSMLDLDEETPREMLQAYLLGLSEGTGVAVSLVLDRGEYSSVKLYRRTAVGFVLVMRTRTEPAEGFALEVF
jgi:hypothetical protein